MRTRFGLKFFFSRILKYNLVHLKFVVLNSLDIQNKDFREDFHFPFTSPNYIVFLPFLETIFCLQDSFY